MLKLRIKRPAPVELRDIWFRIHQIIARRTRGSRLLSLHPKAWLPILREAFAKSTHRARLRGIQRGVKAPTIPALPEFNEPQRKRHQNWCYIPPPPVAGEEFNPTKALSGPFPIDPFEGIPSHVASGLSPSTQGQSPPWWSIDLARVAFEDSKIIESIVPFFPRRLPALLVAMPVRDASGKFPVRKEWVVMWRRTQQI